MANSTSRVVRFLILAAVGCAFLGEAAAQSQLEEVVVTARKREETLQSVPISVTAFTAESIERQGIRNVQDVAKFTPGLSWDKGVLMDCLGQDQWQLALPESNRPFLVKFLVNDTTWSTGPDYTVPSGVSLTLAPQF